MLKSLNNIYLYPTKYLKLRFTYNINLLEYKKKNLEYIVELTDYNKSEVTVYDLLESFSDNVIANFRQIQGNIVSWDYVSIIYIDKPTSWNLIKVPLINMKGYAEEDENNEEHNLGIVKVSLHFKLKPRPLSHKISGINMMLCLEEKKITNLIDKCSEPYISEIQIKNLNIYFKIVFLDKKKKLYMTPLLAISHLESK